MSKRKIEIVKCSKCGAEGEFPVWESLNSVLDPEAKADLMESCLFEYTCPKCGTLQNFTYDMLYHQMDSDFMIQLCEDEGKIARYKDMFDEFSQNAGGVLKAIESEYKFRIVRSRNRLREKIYIFDHNLDDRVIEIMKLFLMVDITEKNPDHVVDEMFLEISDKVPSRFAIHLTNGQWGSCPFIQEIYDRFKEDMIDPSDDGKREYFVDLDWASRAVQERAQHLNDSV